MFTSPEELLEFKEKILALLHSKGGSLSLNEICKQFKELTGKNIKNWFIRNRHIPCDRIPKPLYLFQNYLADLVDIDFIHTGVTITAKVKSVSEGKCFQEHLKLMSAKECENQLKNTVDHVQGSTKDIAIDVEEDDDIVEVKSRGCDEEAEAERAIQDEVENFQLYRDFQMIHITYIKLRIVSMYNNHGVNTIAIQRFIHTFKAMFCEHFFARNILKRFISDSGHRSEDFVACFIKRFCTEFLNVNEEKMIRITQSIPSVHLKFLNQLISALEKLATPGHVIKELDPTPPEMMMLGKAADGTNINTKLIRNRNQCNTFINFPGQNMLNSLTGANRPTLTEVNERVNQIRNRICREGRSVKLPEVIQELCSFYKVTSVGDLYPTESRDIRREGDIPALYDIIAVQGKVNAFIQAFIEFRNICTLHELEEELCKMESKSTFADLKLGPLQKQLLIYEFFKFPPDRDTIPSITTLEVFRLLWKCQSEQHRDRRSRDQRDRDRLTLHQFMEFFIKQHGFNDPFESGVRINSIGLAISVVRKAWFGDMHNIRESVQKFTKQLCEEFDQHLKHAANDIVGNNKGLTPEEGEPENLIQKIAGMNLLEGFGQMYSMLQKMKREACKTLPGTAHLVNFSDITMNALSVIQKDELMRRIFHVLLSTAPLKILGRDDVTILNSLGFKAVIEIMLKEEKEKEKAEGLKKDKPVKKSAVPKAMVTSTTRKWLSKNPDLSLNHLSNIESQVTSEIGNYDSFDDLGHGSFLNFIYAESKLRDIVNSSFGTSGGKSKQVVSKKEINSFVYQCGDGRKPEEIAKACARQFNIQELDKSLHAQLEDAVELKERSESSIFYQHAFLCGSDIHEDISPSEIPSFAESAFKRIFSAPYLICLNNWTNWDLMFEAKLGPIKEFLQNCPQTGLNFFFMETSQNKFIKVMKDCPYDQFFRCLKTFDAAMTASCILSIITSSCHISNAPIALLSNHIQNTLLEVAGKGGEESGSVLDFCLDCFALIPFEILCCTIRKLFLSPLATVFGTVKVPKLLLEACSPYSEQKNVLHLLGFNLSIEEWINDYKGELKSLKVQKEPVICIDDDVSAATDETVPILVEDEKEVTEQPIVVIDVSEEEVQNITKEKETQKEPDKIQIISDDSAYIIEPRKQDSPVEEEDFSIEVVVESDEDVVSSIVAKLVDKVVDGDAPEPVEEIILDPVTRRLRYCHTYIKTIQREQFGVGLTFGVEEGKLIEILRERQGRSLYRLSQELYTKDSHFVLELIQNADDNDYEEEYMTADAKEKPTVAFIVEQDKITILNNEKGFMENNVKALCDVGKSTKGKHRKGYIGQKGIGFKSVFRVTDSPEIHSNGFHIKFDAKSGANGYICPQWVDEWKDQDKITYQPSEKESFSWTTQIVLPLKEEMQHSKLTSRFHDIHPSLLMFLNRLHTIIIDDKVSGTLKVMSKEVKDKNLVNLCHNDELAVWFVVSKEISIDLREDIKTTDISVAFPIEMEDMDEIKMETLPVQPVFAFLPLRSYGFKFIIQADFEVPSSREDIDKDSSWNQCVLRHIPQLVVDAFRNFKSHSHFKNLKGVIDYFKFMDLEDHVLGVFKQVGRNIIKSLQREACLPVDMGGAIVHIDHQEEFQWVTPSSIINSKSDNKLVINPEMLKEHLGLYYVHKDIQNKISPYILQRLGVSKLSLEQLVEISKALIRQHNEKELITGADIIAIHAWIGQWMHIIYKTLQENCDCSQETMDMIKSLNVFALCDGSLVSLLNVVVFFPVENVATRAKVSKDLEIIENDLSIISRSLTSKLDQVQLQQVMRLLKNLGVKRMTPADLINDYIIPIFKTGRWKEKSDDLLIAFVAYLHKQLLIDPNLFDLKEIEDCIALHTNKGFVCPANEFIYFTSEYGNSLDLPKKFPACKWTLISSVYILSDFSTIRRRQWEEFFGRLGLHYFTSLRQKKETLHKSDMVGTVWETYSENWRKTTDDTYVINDLVCPEFNALLEANNSTGKQGCVIGQLGSFALEIDSRWKKNFAHHKLMHPKCIVENTDGERIETTYSSFALKIMTSAWIPSSGDKTTLFLPRELYLNLDHVRNLLANKVDYLTAKIKDEDFILTLGVLSEVSFDRFVAAFKIWRETNLFTTTFLHTINMYYYLRSKMKDYSKEIKELVKGNFIFLLSSHCNQRLTGDSSAEGSFFKIKHVCWEDPSGLIVKSNNINHRRILQGYYPDNMRDFFVNEVGIDRYPSTKEYLNLVYNISSKTTLPDKEACSQICTLFSVVGETCILENMRDDLSSNWYLPEEFSERVQLYTDLGDVINPYVQSKLQSDDVRDEKIFPTSGNKFVSLSQKPLLAFNDDLAPVFKKEENVPIIFIDTIVKMLKTDRVSNKPHHKRSEENEQVKKLIRILSLFKACGLELLSDVYIPPEVITVGLTRGCRKWEQILHDITPYVQRYVAFRLPDVYQKSKANNFKDYLRNSTFFTVQALEVIYRLKDRPDVNVKQTKVSNVEDYEGKKAMIYVTEKSVDDKNQHENIMSELMAVFVGKLEQYREILLDFATLPNKHTYLSRKGIPSLPHGQPEWVYPEPERIAPPPKPSPIHQRPFAKTDDGVQTLRCWPPRNPGAGVNSKPESVRKEEEEISKKWKQPEAPGKENDITIPKGVSVSGSIEELAKTRPGQVDDKLVAVKAGVSTRSTRSSTRNNETHSTSVTSTSSKPTDSSTPTTDPSTPTTCVSTLSSKTASTQSAQPPGPVPVTESEKSLKSAEEETEDSSKTSPLKRKRTAMDDMGDAQNITVSDEHLLPRAKKPFSPSTTVREKRNFTPDYSAPQSKNIPTNKINLNVLGHSSMELDEVYEDLPFQVKDDLEEGELSGINLQGPDKPENEEFVMNIAKRGEEVVFNHLCNVYKEQIDEGKVSVDWLNSSGESKSPYDVKVTFAEVSMPIYIEVKATIIDERKEFRISSQQLKFAFSEGSCFHLYRVSGLGSDRKLKIKRLVNLSSYMDHKAVQLYMVL